MKTLGDARTLARTLAAIGRSMGKRVTALLTSMDEPLGRAVGNALEVVEAVETLRGAARPTSGGDGGAHRGDAPARGEARNPSAARAAVEAAIADGRGLAKLVENRLGAGGRPGGDPGPGPPPRAPSFRDVPAPVSGFVSAIDAEAIGLASVALGPAGPGWTTGSTPPWASWSTARWGNGSSAASRSARSTTARGASRRSGGGPDRRSLRDRRRGAAGPRYAPRAHGES